MRWDFVLVGGGLQNGLIALAILHHRPETKLLLLERATELGGNHTWCFHEADLPDAMIPVVEPLVVRRWPGYDVHFPRRQFTIDDRYTALNSATLHAELLRAFASAPNADLRLKTNVHELSAQRVLTDRGDVIEAELVIDARGPSSRARSAGFQKFFGLDLRLTRPHGLQRPILMDARVSQDDGFRFMYVLPFDERTLLVEDTFFSNTPALDAAAAEHAIHDYCLSRDWEVESVLRQESGCLPMPWAGPGPDPRQGGPLVAGYAGGWYHPGTGYSFPVAARLAAFVASRSPGEIFGADLQSLAREQRNQMRFCRLLNNLMFRWYPPRRRSSIFERFYGLSAGLIRRFYALQLRASDRWRLLLGRPPAGLSLRYRIGRGSNG